MSASLVPGATDALVTMITTALPTATVTDGPLFIQRDIGLDYVTVGATPNDEGTTSRQTWSQIGRQSREEDISIPCHLYTSVGDNDATSVKTARDHAFTVIGLIETALRNDPTLGGVMVAGWVEMAGTEGHPLQSADGYGYEITFHITGRGRL